MTKFLRIAALSALALGTIVAAQPSQAQTLAVGGQIQVRLTPRPDIPYIPGKVPSQCLPYTLNGAGVLFCDPAPGAVASKWDSTQSLFFGGFKPPGFKTPDDCLLRPVLGAPAGFAGMFCQLSHKW